MSYPSTTSFLSCHIIFFLCEGSCDLASEAKIYFIIASKIYTVLSYNHNASILMSDALYTTQEIPLPKNQSIFSTYVPRSSYCLHFCYPTRGLCIFYSPVSCRSFGENTYKNQAKRFADFLHIFLWSWQETMGDPSVAKYVLLRTIMSFHSGVT